MGKGIREIEVKLVRARVERLYELHDWMIGNYVPENAHEHLLHGHLVDMYWRLEKLLQKDEWKSMKIKITAAEAIAFCQLWGDEKISHDPYGNVIVGGLIGEIDKQRRRI